MDIIKLCFAFLGIAFLIFLVRRFKEEFAMPAAVGAAVVFFGYVIRFFAPIYDELSAISSFAHDSGYVAIMLKALAVAGVSRFSSEICRDLGENGVAQKVEVLGKLGIISLSLPLLRGVLEIINRLV